jgi:hypothetical protein
VTPLGLLVSEPAKAVLVRDRVALPAALAGLAVENIFYSATAALVIGAGAAVLLVAYAPTDGVRIAAIAAAVAAALFVAAGAALLAAGREPVSAVAARLAPKALARRLPELRALEERVYSFARRRPSRLATVLALQAAFHAAGVAEVHVILRSVTASAAPSLVDAFVLETVNRAITVVFKLVPLRLGVDEAGSAVAAEALGFAAAAGVTLAIVRKARVLCWTAAGVALLLRRGFGGSRESGCETAPL